MRIDLENHENEKILRIKYKVVNSEIYSKMHGQSKNIKPIGYIIIESENHKGISEIYVSTYISYALNSIFEFLDDQFAGKNIAEFLVELEHFSIPFSSRNGILKACIGCIENACLDLIARIREVPLHKLITARESKPRFYASGGSVIYEPDEISIESEKVIDEGYSGYKIRVGKFSWKKDIKRIDAIKESSNVCKMIDGICGTRNPCWSLDDVLDKIEFFKNSNIYWLEEPLHPDNLLDHAILQDKASFDIAAGEAYSGYGELLNLIKIGNINQIQFDACHSGGISTCLEIAKECKKNEKKCSIHVWGSLVAQMVNYHLSKSIPNIDFLEVPLIDLEINNFLYKDKNEVGLLNIILEMKDLPGIGIDPNIIENISSNFKKGYEYKW